MPLGQGLVAGRRRRLGGHVDGDAGDLVDVGCLSGRAPRRTENGKPTNRQQKQGRANDSISAVMEHCKPFPIQYLTPARTRA